MNRQNDLHAYMFEQSTHSGVVIACFDAFCQTIKKKTVSLLDNASIHTSEEFEERMPSWKKQGLILKYLSPYSPELNLIEILWRQIDFIAYKQHPELSLCTFYLPPAGGGQEGEDARHPT